MRITEYLADSAFRRQIQSTRTEMVKYNDQVATGKKVQKASDDTVAFSSGKLFEELVRRNDQFKVNASNGLFQARTVQEGLDKMKDLMISMKTLAIEAASESKNETDRANTATQIRSMKDEFMELANTDFNDLYVFGGTHSNEKPFFNDPAEPGGVGTHSNDTPLKVLVGDASIVDTTISGLDLRQGANGDLFAAIEDTITALENNDTPGIQASIDNIDDSIDHLIGLSTKVANSINRLEFSNERLEDQAIDQKGEISRLTDADIVDSMLNFQNAQMSYQSVLSIQSRMMQTSLLDYLR